MSIRPMDLQSVYMRMAEVSREQDKEIKKEERERSFQKRVQKFREEAFDHSVNRTKETHADQRVKEHEERGLPSHKKHANNTPPQNEEAPQKSLVLDTSIHSSIEYPPNAMPLHLIKRDPFDPDLGQHINIES